MIEFFFDCGSPWTWLAFHNLQSIARELKVEVRWRPVLLGGILNAVNPSVYEFRERGSDAKKRYIEKDIQGCARVSGLTICFPNRVFPLKSMKVMRGCLLLEPQGALIPFANAAFEAYWSREEDLADDEVLAALCRELGIDPKWFLEGIATSDIKAQLRANTEEVIRRGGFGTPTMFVGGDDMYFGNDRLDLVRRAAERIRAQSSLVVASYRVKP